MIQVVLIREPRFRNIIYRHDVLADAQKRAEALADLHSAKIQYKSYGFVIDASDYYNRTKKDWW